MPVEEVMALKTEVTTLREENIGLKVTLKLAEQLRDVAQKQTAMLSSPKKAGPLGTVKSLRTQPLVQPNKDTNPKLAAILAKVAPYKELIVGIANNNVREMVRVWFTSIKKAGIQNYLLVALDDQIAEFCKANEVPFYRRDATISAVQKDTGENHAISGLKFHLLREFLELGYSVLLSDVDILYFQNPFLHLYRDCDVEAMSDGFNNLTAYGFDDVMEDPKMGWSRFAHTMRIWVFNSGFFYIRPTIPSIELLDRVTSRLTKEKAWDQAVFNEELFRPSHPGYEGLHASTRVMDFYLFMNSKVMFTILRKDAQFAKFLPAALHVNYHPDKYDRMLALVEYFINGKKDALNRFPDGSEWR
ncbi:hypothetical protein L7F22_023422 [Adiantum nelumboides]|nr:hypothetical protein [Adiantum nelumboides]